MIFFIPIYKVWTCLSFCIDLFCSQPNEDSKGSIRQRYNGRQLLSWLQDVDDKYEKIKVRLLQMYQILFSRSLKLIATWNLTSQLSPRARCHLLLGYPFTVRKEVGRVISASLACKAEEFTTFPTFYKAIKVKCGLLKGTGVMTGIQTHTQLIKHQSLGPVN